MRRRVVAASLLGVSLIASVAVAQVKPDQRITISKGSVMLPPKPDTVYLMRYDTVFVTVRDTVRVPLVQVDTVRFPYYVRETPPPPPPALPKILYGSFYTGMTMPSGNIDRMYSDGFHVGVALGLDDDSTPLGLRLNTGVAKLGRENGLMSSVVGTSTPWLIASDLDLKVRTPDLQGLRLYGIGGVTFNAYRGLATVAKEGTGIANADGRGGWYDPARNSDWKGAFGFNAGAGADMLVGSQDLFLEARAMTLQRDGARSWFIPVSFGLRFF